MANVENIEASLIYPREARPRDGQVISLRLMEEGDKQRVLNFACSLPPDDLLFLRTDITDPATIDAWVQNIAEGKSIIVLAELEAKVAGYASIHTDGGHDGRVGSVRFEFCSELVTGDSGSVSV